MDRRKFLKYSGFTTMTFLTGCKPKAIPLTQRTSTNALPIKGGLEPYKIPGYEIDEIEINGINYALLPLEQNKTAQVEIKEGNDLKNITLERQTILGVKLLPDNNRTEILTNKAIISPHDEIYFLANIRIENNTPAINTKDNLEESRIVYSKKGLEEKLTQTNGLVNRKVEERIENLKAYQFGGEEFVSLPYKNNMPNTLPKIFIKKQAQSYVERKRIQNGVEVELSLQGYNFIPIRGKEVDIPQPPQQETSEQTPELEAIEIKPPINQ